MSKLILILICLNLFFLFRAVKRWFSGDKSVNKNSDDIAGAWIKIRELKGTNKKLFQLEEQYDYLMDYLNLEEFEERTKKNYIKKKGLKQRIKK